MDLGDTFQKRGLSNFRDRLKMRIQGWKDRFKGADRKRPLSNFKDRLRMRVQNWKGRLGAPNELNRYLL